MKTSHTQTGEEDQFTMDDYQRLYDYAKDIANEADKQMEQIAAASKDEDEKDKSPELKKLLTTAKEEASSVASTAMPESEYKERANDRFKPYEK